MKQWFLFAICSIGTWAGPLDNWQTRTNLGSGSIAGIAYHDGVYVMPVIFPGEIITATNLDPSGIVATNPTPGMARAVAYGAGRFVVTGDNFVMSSTNGYNWQNYAQNGDFISVIFANDRFVAVGSGRSIMSTNGTDWVGGTIPVSFSQDVIFGNGIFLASGGSSSNAISENGIHWEGVFFQTNASFYTVGFGEGHFVGITIGSDVMTSSDGRIWTKHGKINVVRPGRISFGNGYFVTAGSGARAYSDDGISWTVLSSTVSGGSHVDFIDGRFIATGYRSVYESDPVTQLVWMGRNQIEVRSGPGKQIRIEAADEVVGDESEDLVPAVITNENGTGIFEIPAGTGKRFFRAVMN